jgi:hypothetical protein
MRAVRSEWGLWRNKKSDINKTLWWHILADAGVFGGLSDYDTLVTRYHNPAPSYLWPAGRLAAVVFVGACASAPVAVGCRSPPSVFVPHARDRPRLAPARPVLALSVTLQPTSVVKLRQGAHTTSVHDPCAVNAEALRDGMVVAISNWGGAGGGMSWLDGQHCSPSTQCNNGAAIWSDLRMCTAGHDFCE